jgi:hypothetical protein
MNRTHIRYFTLPFVVEKQEISKANSEIKTPIADIAPGTKQGNIAITPKMIEIIPTTIFAPNARLT